MAWRIEELLIRGEVDNRVRGRVTGRLWFMGRDEPGEQAQREANGRAMIEFMERLGRAAEEERESKGDD